MRPRPTQWIVVWQGQPANGLLAADMLKGHGLDVREETDLVTRIYVHPQDEPTAQDLFKDWEL